MPDIFAVVIGVIIAAVLIYVGYYVIIVLCSVIYVLFTRFVIEPIEDYFYKRQAKKDLNASDS